jgi:glycosyltransferase involved in cell wall biosynthesis
MRIAIVVAGGVDRSGREHVIPTLLALIERLARRHEVVVYVLRYLARSCTYPLLGATVRDLGRPRGIGRQYRFDIVHGYWALPSGLVAALAGRRLGVPSVVTFDSGEFVGLPDIGYGGQLTWRQRVAIATTSHLAQGLSVCTDYQADRARACGVRTRVIPLGVDCRLFTSAPRSEGPPWRLLNVASLNPVKDHETLLRAFRAVLDNGIDAHLDLVGEDTMGGAVSDLAGRLGVRARTAFRGFLATGQLVPFYQRAHLFVLSSRHEAAGSVVLEAAACGVPVVGTAVGHIADWAPERAIAVPVRDARALASAIEALLADRLERERLALAARTWTLARDADWSANHVERLYTRLLTPDPGQ